MDIEKFAIYFVLRAHSRMRTYIQPRYRSLRWMYVPANCQESQEEANEK